MHIWAKFKAHYIYCILARFIQKLNNPSNIYITFRLNHLTNRIHITYMEFTIVPNHRDMPNILTISLCIQIRHLSPSPTSNYMVKEKHADQGI